MTITDDQAKALRKEFPKEAIGKLPKLTCKQCKDSHTKVCGRHTKVNCKACGNWISERHVDLDYVGHATTTDRLLSVDPTWTWEPVALDQQGAPALDKEGNLWIRLTVCGVTRLGCGDGPEMKQRIGDALRNAAMRFGVALDLWSKAELESHVEEEGAGGGVAVAGQPETAVVTDSPARPCPLCGFEMTDKPLKKQEGQIVHKACPSRVPAPQAPSGGGSGEGADAAALPPCRLCDHLEDRHTDGGVHGDRKVCMDCEECPGYQPAELPSDDARTLHGTPESGAPKTAVAKAREQLGRAG